MTTIISQEKIGIIDYTVFMAQPPFKTKSERYNVTLEKDSACYHVKSFDNEEKERLCWDSFDYLADARKVYKQEVAACYQTDITEYLNEYLSGSGFNTEWREGKIFNNGKFEIENDFHCLNENGYYEGYQYFKITVNPADIPDFKLSFTHGDYLARKHMLHNYLEDTIYHFLTKYFNANN